jgi:thiol-disulfide isomerase/thioredoxin
MSDFKLRKSYLLILLSIGVSSLAFTQSIKPLTIGDKVPDLTIKNIINYKSSSAKISDFKGKLLIIDFWESSCASCIRELPKIESLQKKFKDQIQVLTITSLGTQEQTINMLQRIPVTRNFKLPIALNNNLLRKYFPFDFISHVIWIDGNGTVRAITGTDYIDEKNITSILNGEKIKWPIKKDILDFNGNLPLLDFASHDNIVSPGLIYYSGVTGYIDGIHVPNLRGMIVDSVRGTSTRNYFNLPLLKLCELILNYPIYANPKKIIFEVKDTSRYLFDPDKDYKSDWKNKNTYCYSLTLPLGISQEKTADIIKSDLSRWLNILFDLTVKKESRKIKCLALIRINNDDKLITTKGGKSDNNLDNNDSVKSLTNYSFSALSDFLQAYNKIPIVFDETGIPYDKNVDLELKLGSFQNISTLRKELQRYGLDLVTVEREMEMCVISEKGQ